MAAREFVADDVINTFNRLDKSPKKIAGYFDHLEKVEATDKHTVVFTFKNGNTRTFSGRSLLMTFSVPQFFFHVTTAYALLRAQGVPLGKMDFLAGAQMAGVA